MENNKIYCILCGAENKPTDKFCHKCGQSLNQQDDQLQNYAKDKLKEKATDKIKETATDGFLEMLKNFLNSKAYGVILSLAIIASAGNILTGESKINEFANNIPGMFVDGSVYGVVLDPDEILLGHGITIFGKRDAAGDIYLLYIQDSTTYYSDQYITVTGADGQILRQDELLHYDQHTEISEDYLVAIDDLYCTIESTYNDFNENILNTCTIEMNGPVGIKSLIEYENDRLVRKQEFYDTGIEKYRYGSTGYTLLDNGDKIYSSSEIFFNEDGDILKEIRMSGDEIVETTVREDYPDGSYKYTIERDGQIFDIKVYDAQDRCIEDYAYINGEFNFKEVYEYYETNELLSESFYDKEDDIYPLTTKYYNIDGSLKQEVRYFIGIDVIEYDTIYDGNGSAVRNHYDLDTGALISTSYLSQRDDGIYDVTEVIYYDTDGNVISDTE